MAALHDHRVVTLTGAGGSGKTRRASSGRRVGLVGDFADGVWLVQLAAATTSDQVVALTAQELRIGERSAVPLATAVAEHLSTRECLLVLDNCEHLLEAVAAVVHTLISRCPAFEFLQRAAN